MTTTSAGAPSARLPPGRFRTRAGFVDSSSIGASDADASGVDEAIEHQRHGGLEPGDAERRAIELDHLLVGVVRRVVGRDHVDAAVGDALEHGVAIRGLAQRRVHLEVGVVLDRAVERLVGEREMMRRHLAGHAARRAPCRRARRAATAARSCGRCARARRSARPATRPARPSAIPPRRESRAGRAPRRRSPRAPPRRP